jgi:hypothetical protein
MGMSAEEPDHKEDEDKFDWAAAWKEAQKRKHHAISINFNSNDAGDKSTTESENTGDYFPVFNTLLSSTVTILGGEAGVNYSLRQMKRLQSESMVLARNIGQKGPFGNYSSSINKLKGLGTGLRGVGMGSGLAGVGFSIHQYMQGNIGAERFGLDAAVGGFTLIPGVGPFIGLNYLIIDNTIGVDGAIDYMINHAIQRSELIKQGVNPGPGIGRTMR